MLSKTTQPTLIYYPSNYLPYKAKSVVYNNSEIPCHSRVMTFSNKCLLFAAFMGKRIFDG